MRAEDKFPGPCVGCGSPNVAVKKRKVCKRCYERERHKDGCRSPQDKRLYEPTIDYRNLLSDETRQRLEEYESKRVPNVVY